MPVPGTGLMLQRFGEGGGGCLAQCLCLWPSTDVIRTLGCYVQYAHINHFHCMFHFALKYGQKCSNNMSPGRALTSTHSFITVVTPTLKLVQVAITSSCFPSFWFHPSLPLCSSILPSTHVSSIQSSSGQFSALLDTYLQTSSPHASGPPLPSPVLHKFPLPPLSL